MTPDDGKPFNNPFAQLDRSTLPEGTPRPERAAKGPARAVVRMERKGRGGKEVTAVEQLGLKPSELEAWLKALKNALGCGGVLEGEAIVLQGDQRKRLPQLLTDRGVRKVTVS